MLELKITEKLKPNKELVKVLDNIKYKTKLGCIKIIPNTNLQVVEPTEYLITFPTTLTILEYKVNEINNKPFYIKEYKNKYSLTEIKNILKELYFEVALFDFSEETSEDIKFKLRKT